MFRQIDINRSLNDRFATSWSMHRGCHFFIWERIDHNNYFEGQKTQGNDPESNDAMGSQGCCFNFFSSESARVHNSATTKATKETRPKMKDRQQHPIGFN